MRTKALLVAAAISAVAVSAMAQSNVYSLNIVGYVNYTQPANTFQIIGNPLNTTNNDVSVVFADAKARGYFGMSVYKRNSAGGYDIANLSPDLMDWDATLTVNPGEGIWISTPAGAAFQNTFVGEVVQNTTNNLPVGFSLKASIIPQGGLVSTDLGLPSPLGSGDQIFIWNGINSYDTYNNSPDLVAWDPNEPTLKVGQGFWFYNAGTARNWIRNFTP